MQDSRSWALYVAAGILKPAIRATTKHVWLDGERLPATGGAVIALNHLSHIDPVTAALYVWDHGRVPHYLAKSGLFKNKALGGFLRAAGQIPVERESSNAVGAFAEAVKVVDDGGVVVVYPEATITRDPEMWPMRGKTGAARIAIETGCPVIPVGQWGAQEILPPYTKRPHLIPRRTVTMRVGEPVPLEDLRAQEHTRDVVAEATDRIMAAITRQVELIRNEQAPAERYDMRIHGDRFKKGGT